MSLTPLLNSSRPTFVGVVGGVFNLAAPAPSDGQALPFQQDSAGNLLVNVAVGGGGGGGGTQYVDGVTQATPTGTVSLGKNASNVLHAISLDAFGNVNVNLAAGSITGGNAAAAPTGAAVPASADYTGFNSGGNLVGVSSANPLPVSQQGAVDVSDRSARLVGHVTVDNASLAVTGAFFQATQPVSLAATISDDVIDRAGRLLGHVTVDNASIAVTGAFFQATQPVSIAAAVDVGDRAARLVGVVYGSQAQQLKQTATNFNLQVELATSGTLYDARQIRALTSADVVTVAQAAAASLNATVVFASPQHVIVDSGSVSITGTPTVDVTDRAARLLGHVTVDNASIAVTGTFFQATQPVSIAGTVNVSVQNATLAVTQSTSPWVENVSQFGGSPVVTGTGVGGAGIPRVTVSSDSFPATQSISAASLPLPSNAAQESGGNLAAILAQDALTVSNTRNDAQIIDALGVVIAHLKLLNINIASSIPGAHFEPDDFTGV